MRIVDRYKCFGCGESAEPCEVIIPHTDDKLPEHLKGRDKFIKRVCLAANHPDVMTDWQKIKPEKQSTE